MANNTCVYLIDRDGDTLNLVLVQYCFDDVEHSVVPRPHANSKQSQSFVRTMPSTLQKLREVSTNLTAKFAVCKSTDDDLFTASSAGALPRNRQQVSDMQRRRNEKETSLGKKKDPLFSVMLTCKESEGGRPQDTFVRRVTGAPEPMTVLTFNWSLHDIDRFCTKEQQCTVLSVDPTFNLGDFYVTVTTYRHLLLKNSSGNHPVMMGPIFMHQQKNLKHIISLHHHWLHSGRLFKELLHLEQMGRKLYRLHFQLCLIQQYISVVFCILKEI